MKRGLFTVVLAIAIFMLAVAVLRFAIARQAPLRHSRYHWQTPPKQSQDIDLGEINPKE